MKTSVGWNEFLWSREQGRDLGGWNRSLSTWHRPKRQRQGHGSIILSYGVLEEKTSNQMWLTGMCLNWIKVVDGHGCRLPKQWFTMEVSPCLLPYIEWVLASGHRIAPQPAFINVVTSLLLVLVGAPMSPFPEGSL